MMLDVNYPFHPHGVIVRDRWGREILGVIACNPETGEVITNRHRPPWFWFGGFPWHPDSRTDSYLFLGVRRFRISRFRLLGREYLNLCHGFWPAPLTIEEREPAGSETTAAIKLIFAAITEHNAAIQHSLASLGASAQDATWSARQLQTAPDPNPETAAKIERIRFAAAIRRLSAVLKAMATHSPRE